MLCFLSELQLQLNVMDKKLMQKNEEMNILLNYKVSQKGGKWFWVFILMTIQKSRDVNYFFVQSI